MKPYFDDYLRNLYNKFHNADPSHYPKNKIGLERFLVDQGSSVYKMRKKYTGFLISDFTTNKQACNEGYQSFKKLMKAKIKMTPFKMVNQPDRRLVLIDANELIPESHEPDIVYLQLKEVFKGMDTVHEWNTTFGSIRTKPASILSGENYFSRHSALKKGLYAWRELLEKYPEVADIAELASEDLEGNVILVRHKTFGTLHRISIDNVLHHTGSHSPCRANALDKTAFIAAQLRDLHGKNFTYPEFRYVDPRQDITFRCTSCGHQSSQSLISMLRSFKQCSKCKNR